MTRSHLMTRTAIFVGLSAGLALAACNQPPAPVAADAPPPAAAMALSTDPAPPTVSAPAAAQLPSAPPARVSRLANPRDGYAFIDQAQGMGYGFGDAPPDYSFDYDGGRPWVWRSDDNALRLVEPVGDGDRSYYFHPGADYPFLIRDVDFAYGYDAGALVAVYDRDGRLLTLDDTDRRADLAGRYLARAHSLYLAAIQGRRVAVAAANWSARQARLAAERAAWDQQQQQFDSWRTYHADHDADMRVRWDQERYRREAEAARVALMLNDQHDADLYRHGADQARADAVNLGQRPPGSAPPPQGLSAVTSLFGRHDSGGPGAGPGVAPPQGPGSQPPMGPPPRQAETGVAGPTGPVAGPPPTDRPHLGPDHGPGAPPAGVEPRDRQHGAGPGGDRLGPPPAMTEHRPGEKPPGGPEPGAGGHGPGPGGPPGRGEGPPPMAGPHPAPPPSAPPPHGEPPHGAPPPGKPPAKPGPHPAPDGAGPREHRDHPDHLDPDGRPQ